MGKCPTCGGYVKDNSRSSTFESSQRRIKSVATAIPEVSNVHNYTTAWASIIFSAFACALILLPVVWWVGVFLLDRAGYKKPEESFANGILILAIALPFLLLISWLLERIPRTVIRELAAWRLGEKEIELQRVKIESLAGQANVPTAANLTEADVRFIRVVKQIVGIAFTHLASRGLYKPKEARPWSRDVCKETVLLWDSKKIGWSDAVRLGKYVDDNEIIIDGQLNQGRYPTMDAVNDLLDSHFTRPIVLALPSPTGNGKGSQ